ncbi:MAG: hypothetical protein V7765_05945 [Oleispira sp.]
MKKETANSILKVLLPLVAILIVILSLMKESWVQLLMLPIILLAWYDSCKPIKNDAEENKDS